MKIAVIVLLVVIAALCGGLLWIELERRTERIAARKEAAVKAMAEARIEEVRRKVDALHEIVDEAKPLVEALSTYEKIEWITTAEKEKIWSEYKADSEEAWRLLDATNIDLMNVKLPACKYREDMRAIEKRHRDLVRKERAESGK